MQGLICISDHKAILNALPSDYSENDIDNLVFERKAPNKPSSSMKVHGLHRTLEKGVPYNITTHGLIPTSHTANTIIIPSSSLNPANVSSTVPCIAAYRDLQGLWLDEKSADGRQANILGENGVFRAQCLESEFVIPVTVADAENLAYYGAVLLSLGQTYVFPDEEEGYPIWAMRIGETYVQDYLLSETGGGWYLEWHTDRPHFHMPLAEDATGVYLLAKRVASDTDALDTLRVSAFRIPYGQAVFTKRGAIHCDAGLVGEQWIVGFTTSKHFSTVLLRNQTDDFLQFRFSE